MLARLLGYGIVGAPFVPPGNIVRSADRVPSRYIKKKKKKKNYNGKDNDQGSSLDSVTLATNNVCYTIIRRRSLDRIWIRMQY